jgi:quercetin dioxygenase-like cupin family protein
VKTKGKSAVESAPGAFAPASEIEPVEVCPGFWRRTLVWGEDLMLVTFDCKKGHAMPLHHHVHEQAGYVVSGAIEMTIDGEARLCRPGMGYFIPSDVPHSARAIEDTVVVDAFSPPRREYKIAPLEAR